MMSRRRPLGRLLPVLVLLAGVLAADAPQRASADEAPSPKRAEQPNPSAPPARSPDQVLASLNRAMTWYRQARIVMRSVEGSGVFGPADEQTALRLLGRAFDVAHAEAALLGRDSATASGAGGRRAEEQKKIEAAVRQDERDVERLQARLRDEPDKRSTLERQLAAAQNRLDLERARLEFFAQVRELASSRSDTDDDLEHQIDALREAVPELRSSNAAQSVAAAPTGPTSGTWAMIQRLLALQRSRSRLEDLEAATNELVRRLDEEVKAARAGLRPILTRLEALAKDPTDSGKSL